MSAARSFDARRLAAWAPAVAYMALIWMISSVALQLPSIDSFPLRDKGIHMLEYGALGFLLAHATLRTWPRHARLRTGALAVLITVLWGVLDEIHQAFVPGRSPETLDLVADAVGAALGTGLRHTLSGVRRVATLARGSR